MNWAKLLELQPALAKAILAAATDEDATELLAVLEIKDEDEKSALLAEIIQQRETQKKEPEAEPEAEPTPEPEAEPEADTPVAEQVAAAVKAALNPLQAKLAQWEAAQEQRELDRQIADFDADTQTHLRKVLRASKRDVWDDIIKREKVVAASKADNTFKGFPAGTQHTGVELIADSEDKYIAAVDGFFARKNQRIGQVESQIRAARDGEAEDKQGELVPAFRNPYEIAMNRPRVRGLRVALSPTQLFASFRGTGGMHIQDHTAVRASTGEVLRASVTTSTHAEIYADRMHKRMEMLFHSNKDLAQILTWASSRRDFDDFKAHRIIIVGEYADTAAVSEGATYPTATTPSDLEETLTIAKTGHVDDITFEALTDPDSTKLQWMPDRLVNAILRYVKKDLIDTITTDNPTMNSDSNSLYGTRTGTTVGAGDNSGTTALSVSGVNGVATTMAQFTAQTSGEPIGADVLYPWGIIYPPELRGLAERIVAPSDAYVYGLTPAATTPGANIDTDANLDPWQWKGRLQLLEATHFTNATDWYTQADPSKIDTWEYATLSGVSAPELWVQDSPTAGSVFTADKITYKARFFHASTPIRWQAFFYNDVA